MKPGVLLLCLLGGSVAASQPVSSSADAGQPRTAGELLAASEDVSGCEANPSNALYIPVDSWIYPAVLRLYSLGFLDHIYLGLRPWTWSSLSHMLEDTPDNVEAAEDGPQKEMATALLKAIGTELSRNVRPCSSRPASLHLESTYSLVRAIGGTPLRDSYHLGASIVNDFGRPYTHGFHNSTGASAYATAGRFGFYLRAEFQAAPSATGYPAGLAQSLAAVDQTLNPVSGLAFGNQPTIPAGTIAAVTRVRFLEAYVSTAMLNHVISFGKQDEWLGPAQGGSFAYSNNAENLYTFHIDRVEPLYVPGLSRLTGPFRYEFLVGALRGHTLLPNVLYANNPLAQTNVVNPGNPWVHVEKISLRPTDNLEFGFERTALFGGKGHSPVTLHTFLKSFFSVTAPPAIEKNSREDAGARFGSFDFSYRLPFVRNWLTLYSDSLAHDDVSPIDAPRHASIRPGLYLSHLPRFSKFDVRVEAASTDPRDRRSNGGRYVYWEQIEKQGYTNQGQIFGDWIGREDKGGQAWITYHLSGDEWIQTSWRNQKAAKDFIPGGTTFNEFQVQIVKRPSRNLEVNGSFSFQRWKAPLYLPGPQTVSATSIRLTWFPERSVGF